MALDLSGPLAFATGIVEDLMVDTCRFTVDPAGVRDDVLDPVTLTLTPAGGVVEYEGPCKLSARAPAGQTTQTRVDEGGHDEWAGRFRLGLPLTAPVPPPAAVVEIVTSRDPWLVGQSLTVIGAVGGTYKLSRWVEVEVRQRG